MRNQSMYYDASYELTAFFVAQVAKLPSVYYRQYVEVRRQTLRTMRRVGIVVMGFRLTFIGQGDAH